MGLAIGVGIAIVAVFVLARGGNSGGIGISGTFAAQPLPPVVGSYPAVQPNLSPSATSSPYIATGVQSVAGLASSAIAHGAVSTAGIVTAGINAAASIIMTMLAEHKARLQGATNENNAAQTMVPVVDSFIAKVVNAYHSGQVDAATAASALASMDAYIYDKLRSFVGAPGTSWNDTAGINGRCDKSCTVGCCFYYGDLGPPLSLIRYVLGDRTGRWGAGDPRLSGRTVTVPKVYPSKYSQFSRALYTVTV